MWCRLASCWSLPKTCVLRRQQLWNALDSLARKCFELWRQAGNALDSLAVAEEDIFTHFVRSTVRYAHRSASRAPAGRPRTVQIEPPQRRSSLRSAPPSLALSSTRNNPAPAQQTCPSPSRGINAAPGRRGQEACRAADAARPGRCGEVMRLRCVSWWMKGRTSLAPSNARGCARRQGSHERSEWDADERVRAR